MVGNTRRIAKPSGLEKAALIEWWQPIVIAAFGGFAVRLVELMELNTVPREEHPDFRYWLYWLPYFGTPFIGVGLVWIYGLAGIVNPIAALHIGASGPLILRSMSQTTPQQTEDVPPGA